MISLVLLSDVIPTGGGRVCLAVGREAPGDTHAGAVEPQNVKANTNLPQLLLV